MRVATIDIGTNTVLLLVAERGADGQLRALEDRAAITRLGEGVDKNRRLTPGAVERTCSCLDDYAGIIRASRPERVAVVGTSAMRDAGGGEVIREHVRAALGVEARVVAGEEEARLMFRGAVSGLALNSATQLAVFDIGGGSTEVALGRAGNPPSVSFARSYDIGSVRLTERHAKHDPATPAERDAIVADTRSAFVNVPPLFGSAAPIGIAGTMTTLAAVSLGLDTYDSARVHGHVMTLADLEGVVDRLARLDPSARRLVAALDPLRADVIVAGGLIAQTLLEAWGSANVCISDRGVRWGLAEDLCH